MAVIVKMHLNALFAWNQSEPMHLDQHGFDELTTPKTALKKKSALFLS